MTEVKLLEGDALEQMFRRVAHIYDSLLGTRSGAVRPYGLLETLLHGYPGMDADGVVVCLESLIAGHGQDVRRVIEEHSAGAADYLESRDWIYGGPEVLLVADLARYYPARLRAVADPSDFAAMLEPMANELNGK